MTLNEFTQCFNGAFTLLPTKGGYDCLHDDDGLVFTIKLREEELSFGEAMGYGREKERPVIDPADAIYEACYCDGDTLEEVFIVGGNFPGGTYEEQLRNLLDLTFARSGEQRENRT